jgi:hypothetical protein
MLARSSHTQPLCPGDVLLPWSASMTVSSSLLTSSPPSCRRDSSREDPRLPRYPNHNQLLFASSVVRKTRYCRRSGYDALVSDALRCLETIGRCGIVDPVVEERIREERAESLEGEGRQQGTGNVLLLGCWRR